MDKQDNIIIGVPSKKKFDLNDDKWDIFLIAVFIILIIFFPFGVLPYFWGRMNFLLHIIVLMLFVLIPSMFLFFIINIFRLFRKSTWKKKGLILIEIFLSAFFIISLFLPNVLKFNLYDSSNPFLCGYRDRIRNKIDIKETQNWLKTEFEKYNNDEEFYKNNNLRENLPDCLKPLRSDGSFSFRNDDYGRPAIEQICGATFLDWGLIIEMEDMPFPDAEFFKNDGGFWLTVAPGVYVYAQ